MDEYDVLEEIKSLVERASVFSMATIDYHDGSCVEYAGIVIDLPREGRFVVTVRPA